MGGRTRRETGRGARLTAALVALLVWGAALRTAGPTVSYDDSGEFTVAAVELGVAHPPGYAPSTMLHALATHLPVGSIPFRLTLVSAASYAVSAVALLVLLRSLGTGRFAGAASALAAALAAAPWSQATTAKGGVYLLVSALLTLAAAGALRGTGRTRIALPYSLALSVH